LGVAQVLLFLAFTLSFAALALHVIWKESGPVVRQLTDTALVVAVVICWVLICAMPDGHALLR
jgi:hypothetical protein